MDNERWISLTMLEEVGLGLLGVLANVLSTLIILCGLVALAVLELLTPA